MSNRLIHWSPWLIRIVAVEDNVGQSRMTMYIDHDQWRSFRYFRLFEQRLRGSLFPHHVLYQTLCPIDGWMHDPRWSIPYSIQIDTGQAESIATINYAVRIHHRNQLEDKTTTKFLCFSSGTGQKLYDTWNTLINSIFDNNKLRIPCIIQLAFVSPGCTLAINTTVSLWDNWSIDPVTVINGTAFPANDLHNVSHRIYTSSVLIRLIRASNVFWTWQIENYQDEQTRRYENVYREVIWNIAHIAYVSKDDREAEWIETSKHYRIVLSPTSTPIPVHVSSSSSIWPMSIDSDNNRYLFLL